MFSFQKGMVWGEDIDAIGIKTDAEQVLNYESCDIVSQNILIHLRNSGVNVEADVAIHFAHPSELVKGAVNVLFFQQFFEYEKHDLEAYRSIYDLIITPGEELAKTFSFVHYWPLAASPIQLGLEMMPPRVGRDGVVFIGNERMRTEEQYRAVLWPFVRELSLYGAGWDQPKYKFLATCLRGVCPIEKMSEIYAAACAAITLHRREYNDRFGLATNRTFHAILSGCLVLSDHNDALRRLMGDDRGVLYFSESEFGAAAGHTTTTWERKQDEISWGRQHILGAHCWSHRLLQLEELIR